MTRPVPAITPLTVVLDAEGQSAWMDGNRQTQARLHALSKVASRSGASRTGTLTAAWSPTRGRRPACRCGRRGGSDQDGRVGGGKPRRVAVNVYAGEMPGPGIPARIEYRHDGRVGRHPGASPTNPPTADFLRDHGLVARASEPYVHFDDGARAVAEWLVRVGVDSLSVKDGIVDRRQTPDGIAVGSDRTWEAKRPESEAGLSRALGSARHQSDWVIIDGSRLGLTEVQAAEFLRRQFPVWGADYTEVIIVPRSGGDRYVPWAHG